MVALGRSVCLLRRAASLFVRIGNLPRFMLQSVMTKLQHQAMLKHRIILQAAFCVEDLLQSQEKGARCRPWITIIAEHMESLFKNREKEKYAKAKSLNRMRVQRHGSQGLP